MIDLSVLMQRLAERADSMRLRIDWDVSTEEWTVHAGGLTSTGPSLHRQVERLTNALTATAQV